MKNIVQIFLLLTLSVIIFSCNITTDNHMFVDVRTSEEFASGSAKGAINIPLDELETNIEKFEGKNEIHVFCRSGNRSFQAKTILENAGIKNVIDEGALRNLLQKQASITNKK